MSTHQHPQSAEGATPFDLPPLAETAEADLELARRHLPVVLFDRLEPFVPVAVGYTVFRSSGPSASFKRNVNLPEGCAFAVEYAVWWDWDIQHLYELEHLWVYLDAAGEFMSAEGSAHGDYHALRTEDGALPSDDGRVLAFSEPGKHAFAGSAEALRRLEGYTRGACGPAAGRGDVLINELFAGKITASAPARRLCKRYMTAHAFAPSYDFSRRCDLRALPLVPWEALRGWIPGRVTAWLRGLEGLPQVAAVLLDCGDTLVDEGTEVKDARGVVRASQLIPGAGEMLAALEAAGYRLALVADGLVASFEGIFEQHGFAPYFEVVTVSETVGVDKPDARMFETALGALGIAPAARSRVVMVGNNLARDVCGANQLGLISVWLDWAPRRAKVPADPLERPDHTLRQPRELPELLAALETAWVAAALERPTVADGTETYG